MKFDCICLNPGCDGTTTTQEFEEDPRDSINDSPDTAQEPAWVCEKCEARNLVALSWVRETN